MILFLLKCMRLRCLKWLLVLSLLLPQLVLAAVKSDSKNMRIEFFFNSGNTTYIINYPHTFSYPITIPKGCEIRFQGGSLKGPIVFNDTKLTGFVNLKGSVVSGTISNKFFDADWLCYKDGKHDDAANINMMIEVCGIVFLKKGKYLLISEHKGLRREKVLDEWQADAHIGIAKSNIELIGSDKDVIFLTPKPYITICIYSPPYQFDKTIRNIKIQNITFKAENNGKNFNQLLHTIRVMGVNGLTIKNCFFDDFYGDAICLHSYGDMPSTGERTRNSNVFIKDNHIKGGAHHSTRNGISVVNGVNVWIENNLIEETSRKDMPGAIDVEANSHAFSIDNIVIKNNTIRNCGGTAGGICINSKGYGAPANNIQILNNHISNSSYGLAFIVQTESVTKNYVVSGNIVEDDTKPLIFVGNGKSSNWTFKNNVFKKWTTTRIPGNIKVEGLILENNKNPNFLIY